MGGIHRLFSIVSIKMHRQPNRVGSSRVCPFLPRLPCTCPELRARYRHTGPALLVLPNPSLTSRHTILRPFSQAHPSTTIAFAIATGRW